jgi:putative ABC transport system permease protein
MEKLRLQSINKVYPGGETVQALRNISLEFREHEFVAILGPSGSGKTTLLNLIGGLDQYTDGDLFIRGITTKKNTDADWDAYRNRSVGFVFQNYNLISHISVLSNVEIAMTLSGVGKVQRRARALEALEKVGLSDQAKKKPNQLSGGQMQRVAIARALVNNPDIILADEPTGALDSHTGIQVLEILKEVSKTNLVIMVTHNQELADQYADRIIHLLDGELLSDSDPYDSTKESGHIAVLKQRDKRVAMSLFTAISLSLQNLLTKKGRTLITAFAGSIGICGVALILALTNGLNGYISEMESGALSGFPITIQTGEQTVDFQERNMNRMGNFLGSGSSEEFPSSETAIRYDSNANAVTHTNQLSDAYLSFLDQMRLDLPQAINSIGYSYGSVAILMTKTSDGTAKMYSASSGGVASTMGYGSGNWQELPDNNEFLLSLYDLIGENSRFPEKENEIAIVVDEYNRLPARLLDNLGYAESDENIPFDALLGPSALRVIPHNSYYQKDPAGSELFVAASPAAYADLYENPDATQLVVTGILRIKENASGSYLGQGVAYTTALSTQLRKDALKADIALAQQASSENILTGKPFETENEKQRALSSLGAGDSPVNISIYPSGFAAKDEIKAYLEQWNDDHDQEKQVIYSDMAEMIMSTTGTVLNTVSAVLAGFAAISLIVSTIMIGIITYVSVLVRTREIGVLRAVGARKRDIASVFNAETLLVGFTAGVIGILLTMVLLLPINIVIERLADISSLGHLVPFHALALVIGSMILTLIAGLLPAGMAARKDPVAALRSE